MGKIYVGLDIGGTWLKGVVFTIEKGMPFSEISAMVKRLPYKKVKSRLGNDSTVENFIEALGELMPLLVNVKDIVGGIGISTAGVVDYAGKNVTIAAKHLHVLTDNAWINYLKSRFNAPITIINDADAASIGAAALGYLTGSNTIGVMPIGTGLGLTIWRNGRKWAPKYSLPLLGCVYTPIGCYDELVSVSGLSKHDAENNLWNIFTKAENLNRKEKYLDDLAGIIRTAYIIYNTSKVMIGGGLADAVTVINYPLARELKKLIDKAPLLSSSKVEIEVMPEGNTLPLIGVSLIAIGEEKAQSMRNRIAYSELTTEASYDSTIHLEKLELDNLIYLLWKTEQEAGAHLEKSLQSIAKIASEMADRLQSGGRIIYVGAGTSGRLAALDAVEIACTFGFPRHRVITLIAGGIADASIEIETNFEEDASCVPELLLTNVNEKDIVIGISASGSAYYVQSALALAKYIGAYSVIVQEEEKEDLSFCDKVIALHSGHEVLVGSTRMKAGTATKKVLNFLSTTTMVKLGNVHGCYMTEMECINEKLIKRAQNILKVLFDLGKIESYKALEENSFVLNRTINAINKKLKH